MPIKQLGDVRPVVLGLIKIGDKGGPSGAPRKFDSFKIYLPDKDPKGQPTPDDALQQMLEEKHGSPLKRLPVFFLANTRDANMDCSYRWYGKVGERAMLICQGDGEKAQRLETKGGHIIVDDRGNPRYTPMTCPCEKWNPDPNVDAKQHPCKWAAKIACMLRDAPRGGGYFLFRTHSLHSIRSIYFAMTQLENLTFRNMAGIPVTMIWEQQRNTQGRAIPVVRIEWNFDPQQLQLRVVEQVRATAGLQKEIQASDEMQRRLLSAPEDPETIKEIGDEFYPETEAAPEGPEAKDDSAKTLDQMVKMPPPEQAPPEQPKPKRNRKPREAAIDSTGKPPVLISAGQRASIFNRFAALGVPQNETGKALMLATVSEITGKDSTTGMTRKEFDAIMEVLLSLRDDTELEAWLEMEKEKRGSDEKIPGSEQSMMF